MSDFAQLLIGLALLLSSFGAVMVLRPHRGKDAIPLVKMPFVGPLLASSDHGRFWSGRPSSVRLFHNNQQYKNVGLARTKHLGGAGRHRLSCYKSA